MQVYSSFQNFKFYLNKKTLEIQLENYMQLFLSMLIICRNSTSFACRPIPLPHKLRWHSRSKLDCGHVRFRVHSNNLRSVHTNVCQRGLGAIFSKKGGDWENEIVPTWSTVPDLLRNIFRKRNMVIKINQNNLSFFVLWTGTLGT